MEAAVLEVEKSRHQRTERLKKALLPAICFFLGGFCFLAGLADFWITPAGVPNPWRGLGRLSFLFTPLPLLALRLTGSARQVVVGALSNLAVVGLGLSFLRARQDATAGVDALTSLSPFLHFWQGSSVGGFSLGWFEWVCFLLLGVAVPLVLAEGLRRKALELGSLAAWLTLVLAGGVLVGATQALGQADWVGLFWETFKHSWDLSYQALLARKVPVNLPDLELLKHQSLVQLPSLLGIFLFLMIWLNALLLLRLNPQGLRERLGLTQNFFQAWKWPDHAVWVAIGAGALTLAKLGRWSEFVGFNVLYFTLALYGIQGLAVVSHWFTVWKLPRSLYWLLLSSWILFADSSFLPWASLSLVSVVSLGFFDLWFDFRGTSASGSWFKASS